MSSISDGMLSSVVIVISTDFVLGEYNVVPNISAPTLCKIIVKLPSLYCTVPDTDLISVPGDMALIAQRSRVVL